MSKRKFTDHRRGVRTLKRRARATQTPLREFARTQAATASVLGTTARAWLRNKGLM